MRARAFTVGHIAQQLWEQAIKFINDPSRNDISEKAIEISRIFSWFQRDFTKNGSLIEYLNKYAKNPIDEDSKFNTRTIAGV